MYPHLSCLALQCVLANKFRLSNLKKTLAISSTRYLDMEWRLDIELARRNFTCTTPNPKYMVRLDFTNEDHSSVAANLDEAVGSAAETAGAAPTAMEAQNVESLHLELSYSNMKNLQRELQTALDQMNSLHCQRFAKYIS